MRYPLSSSLCLILIPSLLSAVSIQEHVQTTLDTNPKMQQHIGEYKSVRYDLDKAYSGYKPSVDISGAIGPESTKKKLPNPDVENDLVRKEAGVVVTENLFEGLGTMKSVEEQKARIEATRQYVMQEANTLALRSAELYVAVVTNKMLLDIELENVRAHERIYKMTREKMQAGLGRRSDMEQTEARMALAHANYITQQNNYQDAMVNFLRVNGSIIGAEEMTMPDAPALPAATLEELTRLAVTYSPTLQIEYRNVDTQMAKYDKEKSGFYPRVDAELSADYQRNVDGFENDDRAYRAMLRLYYNLYNGGNDEATRLQNLENIAVQKSSLSEQERAVVEKLQLAWMSYQYNTHRIRCLELHARLSDITTESYAEEYHLGRRGLIHLLNVELEANDAHKELIKARSELLMAQYRLLEAMGLITYALESDVHTRVDLEEPADLSFEPSRPIHIVQYGNPDDYLDITKVCTRMFEPITQIVYEPEPKDPVIAVITMDGINFNFDSSEILPEGKTKVNAVAEKLRENSAYYVEIHGHTDNTGPMKYNQWLSERRANAAQALLLKMEIIPERIHTFGHSYLQPVADNGTEEGRAKNRRVEFILRSKVASE